MSLTEYKPGTFYYTQIKRFMDKFLVPGAKWSIQKHVKRPQKLTLYLPGEVTLTQEHFLKHFYYGGQETSNFILGSLAGRPSTGSDGVLKWICFDIDSLDKKEAFMDKAIPAFAEYGIACLIEHGKRHDDIAAEYDSGKFWLPVNCTVTTARHLVFQVGEETGLNFYDANGPDYYDEIFGVNKIDFVCRFPLSLHLFSKVGGYKIHPIEIDGEYTWNPEDFIRWWLKAPQPSEEELKPLLKPLKNVVVIPEIKKVHTSSEFFYHPRRLPLPTDLKVKPPAPLREVFANCQAARDVLDGIVHDNYIMDRVKSTHLPGLAISGLLAYNDHKKGKIFKDHKGEGWEFFDYLVNEFRDRDDSKHQWNKSWEKAEKDGADRVFWSCKAFDEKFGACQGCPWRGKIQSPKRFITGRPITKELINTIKLATPEEIRQNTFPLFKKRIQYFLDNNMPGALLLASPMGSGKSYLVSEAAAELAAKGYKILIAVPTADLAMEHRNRIDGAFSLLSHKSIFKKKKELGFKFNCPYNDEIQNLLNLGVGSGSIKKDYCAGCPFVDECHYPRQYTEVMEEKNNVVIIQHAHFSCQEVIYDLMEKQFDVLFVDESFIKSVYKSIKVKPIELSLLKDFDYKWVLRLLKWLRGSTKPKGKLEPSEKELRAVWKAFKKCKVEWRIPEFIRFYNQGRQVNKYTGIEVVYELPNVPLKVFTDATPPKELLKRLTGLEVIETWGDQEILDMKRIHPDNEVIQVLDTSASRAFLEKDDNLEQILTRIGEVVEEKHKGKKVLITVASKAMQEKVKQFFLDYMEEFPTPKKVGLMSKGVNTWKDYDVLFLLAGRYSQGAEYALDIYKYKTVANYYKRKKGEEEYNNIYPGAEGEVPPMSLPTYFDEDKQEYGRPVIRIEPLAEREGGYFKYDQFKVYPPTYFWPLLCYDYNRAETAQAVGRIRPTSKRPVTIYILNNYNLEGILVNKSILLDQFLNDPVY